MPGESLPIQEINNSLLALPPEVSAQILDEITFTYALAFGSAVGINVTEISAFDGTWSRIAQPFPDFKRLSMITAGYTIGSSLRAGLITLPILDEQDLVIFGSLGAPEETNQTLIGVIKTNFIDRCRSGKRLEISIAPFGDLISKICFIPDSEAIPNRTFEEMMGELDIETVRATLMRLFTEQTTEQIISAIKPRPI